MSMPHPLYIDIHTHLFSPDPSVWAVRSFHQQEKQEAAHDAGPLSIGLHPWFLEAANLENDWTWLEKESARSEVVAIGETGLDRMQGPDLSFQEEIFLRHIRLAEARNKPLIIHCVRAWEELERVIRQANSPVPMVLHGFQKKEDVLERFLSLGLYFSFGAALLREGSTAQKAFCAAPLNRVFLETDDGTHPIQSIYEKAATLRGMELPELIEQIHFFN
ncbi:MAG: TatD family hydrolase [Saprospirales bacterium]|nr:TatD family hydrolase [Saprospirales bacterium]MBK8491835.1 TatD family hydrolase [Saprospirales bacterium]